MHPDESHAKDRTAGRLCQGRDQLTLVSTLIGRATAIAMLWAAPVGAVMAAPLDASAPAAPSSARPPSRLLLQAPNAAVPAPAAPGLIAASSWPARFSVAAGERDSFGFAVGQPGRIVVTVTAKGDPVSIVLRKPDGGQVERTGTGRLVIEHNASASEVARSLLWAVAIAPAGGPRTAPGVLASGTVTVEHPPADPKRVEAELAAGRARAELQLKSRATAADATASLVAKAQAELDQKQVQQQAVALQTLSARLSPQAVEAMKQSLALRSAVGAGAVPTASAVAGQRTPSLAAMRLPTSGTATQTQSASTGVAPVGSGGTAAAIATPTISALSVSEGQPGDPVLITGSGFGSVPGEVRFIVAQGKDLAAPLMSWSDTQIFVAVPDVSGLQAFAGQVYVKHSGGQSRLAAFRFKPALEVREIRPLPDTRESLVRRGEISGWRGGNVDHNFGGTPFGAKDFDEFFQARVLRNGWTVREVVLPPIDLTGTTIFGAHGNVTVAESRPGTTSPYVKLHWWLDGFSWIRYRTPTVLIVGPKGVPHE